MSVELGKAYVQIVPSAKGIGSSIAAELGGGAGEAGVSAGRTFGAKFKQIIGTLGLGKIALDAFKEGAALDQAIGGIKALYGAASKDIIKSADGAWQTAGMSARTYMETATRFSASLIKSVGGDTKTAATVADRAISDMSDNANRFGTDISSIQDAYQGFAKQNYTMLDNLNLGFGGTKSGMLELIHEASSMKDEQNELNVAVKDGDLSFANIANAISVVQKHMGITGTTMAEGAKTLSGSFNAMKASWSNFLGDLVNGRKINESTSALATAFSAFFFRNFVPAIGKIAASLPDVVFSFIKTGIPALIQGLTEALPQMGEAIGTALTNIGTYIAEWSQKIADDPSVIQGALKLAKNFGLGLLKGAMSILTGLINMFKGVFKSIGTSVAMLMRNAMNRMLTPLRNAATKVKGIIDKIRSFFNVTLKFNGIKLPHISVSWKKKGNLAKIASKLGLPGVPDFGVNWYKTGGIFDQPSIIGVGEAGAEAVIPLNRLNEFTKTEEAVDYRRMALEIANALGGQTQELVLTIDGDVLVRKTAPKFKKALKTLETRSGRKMGYVGG